VVINLAGKSDMPSPGVPALVRPVGKSGPGIPANALGTSANASDPAHIEARFVLQGTDHGFAPGQRVIVDVPVGERGRRKVVPLGAVIYDAKGVAWVFVASEPLAFVRKRVEVDYIEGDRVVLIDGPAVGVEVASQGVTEIYGTESKIGPVGISASF
jgi:multidrug efflux pump subunit AcrA (membrane-fusion protein)